MNQQNELMGKLVTFTAYYRKQKSYDYGRKTKVTQIRTECALQTGWVVGFRFLPEGTVIYGDREEGTAFEQKGGVSCVLIARTPRETPMRVPLDAFVLTNKGE